jgi:Family of unknown function (DUF6247)
VNCDDRRESAYVSVLPAALAADAAPCRLAAALLPVLGLAWAVVTALPADSQQEDPLDPERILRVLPDRERETFLAQYQQAVDGAHDPAGWKHLKRFLRLWAGRAIAANRPGFYEARDRALAGTGGGMLLEDAIRQYRTGR